MTAAVVSSHDTRPAVPVAVTRPGTGIALITMQDSAAGNGFTPQMLEALLTSFNAVGSDLELRVVVLTGVGHYFSSGGTREGLLAIESGTSSFTDAGLYDAPLRCPLPVIAAMQGHAIGGGFVLGMFADIAILARESIYTTNFMRYGFTPGMGGTMIVPEKLGPALGHEMLLNGGNYRGADLETRGAPFVVLPRAQVLDRALALAAELAEKPRLSLTLLKRHLTKGIRDTLDAAVQAELAMHDATFHGEDVRRLIDDNFDG